MNFAYTLVYVADVATSLAFFEQAFGLPTRFLHESSAYGEVDTGTGGTVLAFVDQAPRVQFFNYDAAPGRKLVTSFTEGVVTQYNNADVFWGAAGAPAAGAAGRSSVPIRRSSPPGWVMAKTSSSGPAPTSRSEATT